MAYFEHFPYTNFHDINLDRMIDLMEQFRTELADFVNLNTVKYADPFDWNITTQYPANTIVMDPSTGVAYISVRPVPAGAPITDTSYWTPVFDLTALFEGIKDSIAAVVEQSTSATVSSPAGTLIWVGNTLYEAQVAITAGDTYRPGGNVEHVTIEELLNRLKAEQAAQAQALAEETEAREEADNALTAADEAINARIDALKFSHAHATEHLDLFVTNYVSHEDGDYFTWTYDDHAYRVPEGNDTNTGTDPEHPLKTFKRALDVMAENAAGAYIHMMGDFNNVHYRMGYPVINAAQIHISADGVVTERLGRQENGAPVLIWGSTGAAWTLAMYDCYIHLNGTSTAPLTLKMECRATDSLGNPITKNAYLEAGKLYSYYVNFEQTTNMRFGIVGGYGQFDHCTFDKTFVSSGNVVYMACTFAPNDSNTQSTFAIQAYNGANVTFANQTFFTAPATFNNTDTFLSASAAIIDVRNTAPSFTGLSTGVLMNQSYFIGNNARINSWLNQSVPADIYASIINGIMYYPNSNTTISDVIHGKLPVTNIANNDTNYTIPYAQMYYPNERVYFNERTVMAGFVTSSGTQLRFTIPTQKILPTGAKVEFESMALTARISSGGYAINNVNVIGNDRYTLWMSYTATGINVQVTDNTGAITTNNSVLAVSATGYYTVKYPE